MESRVDRILDKIFSALITFIGLLVGVISVVIAVNVFSRYVLNHAFVWVEELARFLMIWMGFLGASALFYRQGHISVDFIVAGFPPKLQRGAAFLISLGSLVFFATLLYTGLKITSITWTQWTASLGAIPLGAVYCVVPMSAFFMMVAALRNLWMLMSAPTYTAHTQSLRS